MTAALAADAVAPEVAIPAQAAGMKASKPGVTPRRPKRSGSDPRASAPGSKAAQQRQTIEDIKAARAQAPADQPAPAAGPAPASPGAGLPSVAVPTIVVPAAVQTGSGFLLGLFAWGIGLAYLKGGSAGARRFLAAKFLNKT